MLLILSRNILIVYNRRNESIHEKCVCFFFAKTQKTNKNYLHPWVTFRGEMFDVTFHTKKLYLSTRLMYFIKTTGRNVDRTKRKAYSVINDTCVRKCEEMYVIRSDVLDGTKEGRAWQRFLM